MLGQHDRRRIGQVSHLLEFKAWLGVLMVYLYHNTGVVALRAKLYHYARTFFNAAFEHRGQRVGKGTPQG